jgi:integration host factor subunit alpha
MTKVLNRLDLLEAMAQESDLTVHETTEIFRVMMETFQENLKKGEDLKFPSFGTFHMRQKKARPGRNPKTGESVVIEPKKTVLFRSSVQLRKTLLDQPS